MSLFKGESTKPSTVAADTMAGVTRARYNELRDMYKPLEGAVLPTVGNDNYISLQSKIAGRQAGQQMDLMNRVEDTVRERRGLALSAADSDILDRRRTYSKSTGVRKAQTLGELAAIDNDRISTAGAVEAGNALYKSGINSLSTAAAIESAANQAGVSTGASGWEKFAGVATGAINGLSAGGIPGAIAGGGLAASAYF